MHHSCSLPQALRPLLFLLSALILLFLISAPPVSAQEIIALSWNDLGMHCMNQNHHTISLLPPYNTLEAQLILRGDAQNSPFIVTADYTIEYSIPGNTYSAGKTDFWDYAEAIFGVPLPPDVGLTGLGLTGELTAALNHFVAEGIPITPFPDATPTIEDPYQQALLIVRNSQGIEVTRSEPVIPVSVEMGCVSPGCHGSESAILNAHATVADFDPADTPIFCAGCHADPALGTPGIPEAGYFSEVIHKQHSFIDETIPGLAGCQKCHPGPTTRCLRGTMNTDFGMICQDCHGNLDQVAQSIDSGRIPWEQEPSCRECHSATYGEPPGQLFRHSTGHGGVRCEACHGSPHAIFPSREARDNANNIELQGHAGVLRDCQVCHGVTPSGPGPHGLSMAVDPDQSFSSDGRLEVAPSVIHQECRITLPQEVSQHGQLVVVGADGRLVRHIRMTPGQRQIKWDARNGQGSQVQAGVYYIRYIESDQILSSKALVVR